MTRTLLSSGRVYRLERKPRRLNPLRKLQLFWRRQHVGQV
jgi:hypothetical protein